MKQWLKTARVFLVMAGLVFIACSCERSIQRLCVARVHVARAQLENR